MRGPCSGLNSTGFQHGNCRPPLSPSAILAGRVQPEAIRLESQMPTSGAPSCCPPNQATARAPPVSTMVEAWHWVVGIVSAMNSMLTTMWPAELSPALFPMGKGSASMKKAISIYMNILRCIMVPGQAAASLQNYPQSQITRHAVVFLAGRKRRLLVHIGLNDTGDIVQREQQLHPEPGQFLFQGQIPTCCRQRVHAVLHPEVGLFENVVLIEHGQPRGKASVVIAERDIQNIIGLVKQARCIEGIL